MGQKSGPGKEPAEQVVKEIRRATRRQFSAEEKIRIVLSGLRGEDSIAELCRREGIVQNLYYRWSKDFLEAGDPPGQNSGESDHGEEVSGQLVVSGGDPSEVLEAPEHAFDQQLSPDPSRKYPEPLHSAPEQG